MLKKMFIAMAVLAAATTFIACGGSGGGGGPTAPTMSSVVGVFNITEATVTANGATVTFTPPALNGNINLMADGTFTVQLSFPDLGISESDGGMYTVNGSTLVLRYNDGSTESAVISADSNRIVFTESEGGETVTVTFAR